MRLGSRRIRASPIFSEEADRWIPQVSPVEREQNAYFLAPDGRLWRGDEAVWQCLYRMRGGWALQPLRRIPGFRRASEAVYRWYADKRRPECRMRSAAEKVDSRK